MLVSKRYWPAALAVVGGAILYRRRLKAYLVRVSTNVRDFDLPSAGLYDALVGSVMEPFYGRVAGEFVACYPQSGTVLEVGSGPGRLAVGLGQMAPRLEVTGVDISPEMVERAGHRAREAGLEDRVRFEIGDVGALSFPEGTFDGVISTLSLHHWPDARRGLAEIYRVLKPGGEARIYDLSHRLWPPAHDDDRLARFAAESPFGGGEVETVRWPGSVPAFVLLRLRHARRT